MNVAFISRSTLFSSAGGDTVQMMKTAEYLRRQNVAVDVLLTNEKIEYGEYDLLHFFNIIRPADILMHIRKPGGKRFVVSPIYVEYRATDKELPGEWLKLFSVFSPGQVEYLKTIGRSILNQEKIVSPEYLWLGHKASIKHIAKRAAHFLPNSQSEYKRLSRELGFDVPYSVIPNGIDEALVLKKYHENKVYKNSVLCMGRIEPRKNQLRLIRALNNSEYQLFIHGDPSPNHKEYFNQCKAEAAPNVHIGGWLENDALYTAYANARVHILPSYFETTGLSSLEAAAMGCNIVVTDRGDTKEYFKDFAWYCEPDDIASIRRAVDEAFHAPYNEKFKTLILENYTWAKAAEETLKVYRRITGV